MKTCRHQNLQPGAGLRTSVQLAVNTGNPPVGRVLPHSTLRLETITRTLLQVNSLHLGSIEPPDLRQPPVEAKVKHTVSAKQGTKH